MFILLAYFPLPPANILLLFSRPLFLKPNNIQRTRDYARSRCLVDSECIDRRLASRIDHNS